MADLTPDAALRHLVGWGLVGGPTEPLALGSQPGLGSLAEFHQVPGVVLAAVDGGAVIDIDPTLVDDLTARHLRLLHRTLAVEADLVVVARRLAETGVDIRVLKGGATAHLDYADPALRITSDVDLLVRDEDLDVATEAVADLVDRGATVPDRRAWWTERYGKDRTLTLRSGGELDLHRMTAPGFHGLVEHHDWFADPDSFSIAGTELSAPSVADRFVHAVAHAGYTDHVRYHSIRDVPVLLEAVGDRWRDEVERRRHWRGLLARGVDVVWARLELAPHPLREWAARVEPDRRERFALRTYELPGSRQHWGGVAAVGPWRWPGLLAAIALPSRDYLAYHGRTPASHVGSTVTKIGRSRSGRSSVSRR